MSFSPEDKEYYDNYLSMFASKGWIKFMEEVREALQSDQSTAVKRCSSDQLWFEERGSQARTLKLLAFEAVIKNCYDAVTADEAAEDNPE